MRGRHYIIAQVLFLLTVELVLGFTVLFKSDSDVQANYEAFVEFAIINADQARLGTLDEY